VARAAAELTKDKEPAKAKATPLEAKPLRPGRAARAVVYDGRAVHDAIEAVLAAPGESREVARQAYNTVRDQLVAGELDAMPVDRLRELIAGRVTFAPVMDAGLDTVGKVLAAGTPALRRIPGVRRRAAKRIMAAAWQMRQSVEDGVRREVRAGPGAGDPRRRDGPRQDDAVTRRHVPSGGQGRDPLSRCLPGERGHQLDARG
jgi:hypothetical protein